MSDPAAAFLGFAKSGSPAARRSRFTPSNPERGMRTSPRTFTVRRAYAPASLRGIERMVLMFAVTSSPRTPSPRVAPVASTPRSYVSETLTPSSLSSATKLTPSPGASFRTRRSNARSSSAEYVLSSESMGTAWVTVAKPPVGAPPTRWVGESGVTRAGYSRSRSASSARSRSYSRSAISGAAST